jgi:hypothetical protein
MATIPKNKAFLISQVSKKFPGKYAEEEMIKMTVLELTKISKEPVVEYVKEEEPDEELSMVERFGGSTAV